MRTLTFEIKNEFGALVEGHIQIGQLIVFAKDGMAQVKIDDGTYVVRAIAQKYRGKSQEIKVNHDETITLEVTRG